MNVTLTNKEKRLAIIMGVVFTVTVLGPGVGLQYATTYQREQVALKNQLDKEIVTVKNRLSGIEEEREKVRANRADYLKWVEKGVVGEQDPIAWVKAMKEIQEERNLFPVSYNFEDEFLQQPDVSPFTSESNVQIRLWNMSMEMAMLHDMDTLMFLQSLKQRVTAFFFPVECNFTLLEPDFSLLNRQNMSAECKITWVSVEDPDIKIEVGQ